MATETISLLRASVPAHRLRNAERILARLGMKPGDAFNMLLAQIELCEGLPFEVTIHPPGLLAPESQAEERQETYGAY